MASATKAQWIREYAERERHQSIGFIRLLRQHLRPPNALDRRAPGRRKSGFSLETSGVTARLGDFGFEMRQAMNEENLKPHKRDCLVKKNLFSTCFASVD